jgi:hypothetical protein
MGDYDFYLRQAAIRSGEWVGFRLGWRGLAGVEGLSSRPHMRWKPWHADPANPEDPSTGSWGHWRWRVDVAMVEGMEGLQNTPPADMRTVADMRSDLLAFADLPVLQLTDVDGVVYTCRIIGYEEHDIEQFDAAHPAGGWFVRIELQQS